MNRHSPSTRQARAARLLAALLRNVRGEGAQRGEDAVVVGIVRAQLETVLLRNRDRHLQDVDRIEPEALVAVERGLGVDVARRHLEVQDLDQHLRELALEGRLLEQSGHPYRSVSSERIALSRFWIQPL